MAKSTLSELRIAECRRAARDVLRRFHVETPEAIDLDVIAWRLGRLRIKDGGLSNAEGRIVATEEHGGVIRIAPMIESRRRFTIAHEIGHFVLHQKKNIDRAVTSKDVTIWSQATEEAEANYFAAELLMPDFLFRNLCVGKPTIARLKELSTQFGTSLLATALQYWEHAGDPLAVVISGGWHTTCIRQFKDGWPRVRWGEIHEDSAAGERLLQKSGDSNGMVRTPAYAWLWDFDDRPSADIMEDSFYLETYDTTLTLLWINEPL